MINRRSFLNRTAQLTAIAALSSPAISFAQSNAVVPFSLDFRVYGGNSPFTLAAASGLFADVGVDARVDGSSGSADCISRIATGSHQFGFADIQTLVEFTMRNPDAAPKLIMPILDHSPASIMTIGGQKPTALADLKGKRIGVAANSAATKIMPIVLQLNNIAQDEIEFISVDVRIRDSMLLQGQLDGVVGYDYTSIFNFVDNGVERDSINTLYFDEFGFDFPGNALIASQQMIKDKPDLCSAIALASARAWRATNNDPAAAIRATVAREPLLKADVEEQRIRFILDQHVRTESVQKNGIGYLDPARMSKGLSLMAEGLGWAETPTLEDFYNNSFLPDAKELMILG